MYKNHQTKSVKVIYTEVNNLKSLYKDEKKKINGPVEFSHTPVLTL